MKEIMKLLTQDNGFKLKLFGYQLLVVLIMVVGMIIPMIMLGSYSDVIFGLGMILLYVVIALVVAFALYLYINKLLVKYYPDFEITMQDALKKVLAAFILMFGLAIVFIIVTLIISLIAGLINVGIVYLIAFIIGVIAFFQLAGFALGITYTLFENVARKEQGFVSVFKTYFGNILEIRKECVKISVSVASPVVVLYIIQFIVTFVIGIITLIASPVLYVMASLLLILVFTVLMMWLTLTEYVYIFKRYSDISAKMKN